MMLIAYQAGNDFRKLLIINHKNLTRSPVAPTPRSEKCKKCTTPLALVQHETDVSLTRR